MGTGRNTIIRRAFLPGEVEPPRARVPVLLLVVAVVTTITGCPPSPSVNDDSSAPVEPAEAEAPIEQIAESPEDEPAGDEAQPTGEAEQPPESSDEAIANAIKFLLAQQIDDGSVKSDAYGILRPAAATTALALYAISHIDEEHSRPHRAELQKAVAFLKLGLDEHGKICAPDGTLDYPTYGAAMLLVAVERLQLDFSREDRARLTKWIVDAQLTEAHGVVAESIHHGGWDLEAISGAKGEQLKGSNISITSFALEGLRSSVRSGIMREEAAAAIERGRGWAERCQNSDGGFVFHVWRRHPGNKALWTDDSQADANSYGTPTCDGLRCLAYCNNGMGDDRTKRAVTWLAEHPDVKYVPGFQGESKNYGWHDGLRFYYYFTQAKALQYMPQADTKRRAAALRELLLAEQKPDGSFKNKQPRMFEDDPVLATSLALVALAEAGKRGNIREE